MRVNVSKAFISKTFMYGLKVSLQRQLTKSNKKKYLEFYLKLKHKILKQTLIITATQLLLLLAIVIAAALIKFLTEFATFATLLILTTLIYVFINTFYSFNVFSRLTVLMNDFRLKTFHSKSIKYSKFLKNSTATTTTKTSSKTLSTTTSSFNLKFSTATTTNATSSAYSSPTESSAAAAAVFATSAITSSSNNHHHRTYNNSSKSNKVFLCYTPRDPRLRIFLKTKHFSNRPQQKQHQLNKKIIKNIICCTGGGTGAKKSLFKVFSDLCNYGELIGGGSGGSGHKSVACKRGDNKTILKQFNTANSKPYCKIICDNLKKLSDNILVATVATVSAAIETISANLCIYIIVAAAKIQFTKEFTKTIEILLSVYYKQQQLIEYNVKSGLYKSIL